MKKFALSRLNTAIVKGLCYGSMAATLAVAPQAFAQEETDESASVERVMVTGSRIARDPNLAAPSPVQAIEAKDIQTSGEFSITDIVNDIPSLFSSTNAESANDASNAESDGANILNLRGLGSRRTLVLVNGRRHVGGAGGSSAVDVGSIPTALIDSVEVLTGGASAIYGADAVTGVVNFILKRDFEGFDFDVQRGISSEGDAEQMRLTGTYGLNFDNDKGNVAINIEYADSEGLRAYERDNGVFIGSARDWVNPAKRFQQGDINASTMPHFAQYFSPSNDRPSFGLAIPSADSFMADFEATYGFSPNLTDAEIALINAAAAAPARAILPGRTFPFTSGYGYIIPGNPYSFDGFDPNTPIDLDNNGVPDCYDSFTGYNSVFGAESFGVIGGCWVVDANGTYRPIQDGLVANGFQGFGGDSFNTITQNDSWIINPEEKISANLIGSYEVGDAIISAELKYVKQETENRAQPTSFWDLLFGAADNPYLPEFIQPIANQTGGVAITMDPIGIGGGEVFNEFETMRGVLAVEGEFENGWTYEASLNYGKFERETTRLNSIINDRFLAAIDAVTDPDTGAATCRSSVDPDAPATTTPFNIPDYDPGYYSFVPGDGTCVPLNIWAGATGITQQAVDWVTTTEQDNFELEQLVISASVSGDSADWFELPAGPIVFAFGGEYRDEESSVTYDPWQRGIIPSTGANPGAFIGDLSGNNKLTFRPATLTRNEVGGYDVTDVFFEFQVPLLEGEKFAEELSFDAAIRYSDYSHIGSTTTWKTNVQWAPYEDLTFRLSVSEAIRAPNITEVFGPEIGTTFRPADPCDAAQIEGLRNEGQGALADQTQANCVTYFNDIGLDPFDENGNYNFADPLSAAFGGVTGGNPNLEEETASTETLGFVFRPSFLEGFNMTVDYWSIEIEDAISEVSGQNIADGCFQAQGGLNQNFCQLLGRNSDPNSLFFGGFNFLRSTSINFAKLETDGYDFSFSYDFDYEDHEFGVSLSGTKVNELNDFANPLDLTDVDPELGEFRRPEWAGNLNLSWTMGDLSVGWQTQYQDEQYLLFVESETAQALYGDSVLMDATYVHDINFTFQLTDEVEVYGGINNISDENPFITNVAFPASARGRYFFMGVAFSME